MDDILLIKSRVNVYLRYELSSTVTILPKCLSKYLFPSTPYSVPKWIFSPPDNLRRTAHVDPAKTQSQTQNRLWAWLCHPFCDGNWDGPCGSLLHSRPTPHSSRRLDLDRPSADTRRRNDQIIKLSRGDRRGL